MPDEFGARLWRACAVLTIVVLPACAGDLNPVRDVFVATGLGGVPAEAPEFVARTRPGTVDYLPIGAEPPPRESAAKTPQEVAAMEADLRRTREANEAQAEVARRLAATPAPEPVEVEPLPDLMPPPEPIPEERRRPAN